MGLKVLKAGPWSSGYGRRLVFWVCRFESWQCTLDGYFFTFICCKNCNDISLKRPKINDKRPICKKNESLCFNLTRQSYLIQTGLSSDQIYSYASPKYSDLSWRYRVGDKWIKRIPNLIETNSANKAREIKRLIVSQKIKKWFLFSWGWDFRCLSFQHHLMRVYLCLMKLPPHHWFFLTIYNQRLILQWNQFIYWRYKQRNKFLYDQFDSTIKR